MSLVSEKRGKRVLGRFISLSIMLLVTVTPSISREKGETTAEYYSKNEDITKGTTYYNNSPDVKIRGVDVQTGGIAGKVASLTVESVQDRTDGKSSGYNISYGIGIGEHAVMRNGTKEMADGLHTTNIGVGYSRGKHTERTTNAIGGFTAEHGVLDVIGKTVQTGSVIGGGFTLNTGTYEKNDLEDVNKRKNVGINLTFTPGVTDIYRNGKLTPDSVGGVLVGTRIDYSKDDYVAKVKATIGNSVNMTVAGKKADLSGVNRDTSKMVDVLKDRKITPVSIDLGTEYWATNYGREKTKGDFAKAGNKIERVVEIIKAVSENEGKDIGLYYRDRLDFEAERDRKERSGEIETILIDRDKALEMAERAAGRKIDDLQIISTKDPNIKEIVGADTIAGRAYHVGNGKIVIVADNIGDYAKAMGTIAEEGRHIYHRNNNGLEDSEDYASFYGRQFERYYDRNFGNNDVAFITERLKYTKEQLGNDWENDAAYIGPKFSVGPIFQGGGGIGGYIVNTGNGIDLGIGISGGVGFVSGISISGGVDAIYFPLAKSKNDLLSNYFVLNASVGEVIGVGGSGGLTLMIPIKKNGDLDFNNRGVGIGVSGEAAAGLTTPGIGGSATFSTGVTFWKSIKNKNVSRYLDVLNDYKKKYGLDNIAKNFDIYIKENRANIEKEYNRRRKK